MPGAAHRRPLRGRLYRPALCLPRRSRDATPGWSRPTAWVPVHADAGGVATAQLDDAPGGAHLSEDKRGPARRPQAGRRGIFEDRPEIRLLEVLSGTSSTRDGQVGGGALKDFGVERDLQLALAAAPEARICRGAPGSSKAKWPIDIGPGRPSCAATRTTKVAVEIKRVGTIDAVEQLARCTRAHPSRPREGRARRHPRRPAVQAAGGDPGRVARHPLRRGVDPAVLRGERGARAGPHQPELPATLPGSDALVAQLGERLDRNLQEVGGSSPAYGLALPPEKACKCGSFVLQRPPSYGRMGNG